ncbi:PIN domain-containing protein [Neomoorella thermoacetica]|uniref:PIN domain-containing protein n=1 Tax=Neomoorella thermoacetica TaxID=1525 RepID=UPI00324F14CD
MLDTNILISGMVFRGPERRLLDTIYHQRLTLVINSYIVEETKEFCSANFPPMSRSSIGSYPYSK